MKNLHLFLVFALIAVALASQDHEEEDHHDHHDHHDHDHSCDSCDHHDHSCECDKEYNYKCNDNEWLNYLLDDAPGEDGLFYGDLEPGLATFVGYGEINSVILPGQLQISDPKGLLIFLAQRRAVLNDTSNVFYLKKDCHHHKYDWFNSSGTEVVPFALEPKEPNANGFPTYIARKYIDGKLYFGFVALPGGYMIYYDDNGKPKRTSEYEVLTCKSKVYEAPPPPKPVTAAPPTDPSANTGCVHNWQSYRGDDSPARDGVAAGLYDVDNVAYVGKYFDGSITNVGRVQVSQPNSGVYSFEGEKLVNHPSGGKYLVNNPDYHYYWIDAPLNIGQISTVPNAVRVKVVEQSSIAVTVGRLQVNGKTQIGSANEIGFGFGDEEGVLRYAQSFQILVCDPEPANQCKQNWKPYQNDNGPSRDGFEVDFYENGVVSYIGRSDNKRIQGHDYVIGRVQTTPSNESGVYTLNSVSGGEKFDPYYGEYLVKNTGDLYKWVNAHTGQEIENAISVPITRASDCCNDGHRKETAYIGKFYLDNVVYIGTVYQHQGLAFVDVNGEKKVVSNFQVLTCASPIKCAEAEEEKDHHDCVCDKKCLDEEKFYFI